MADIDTQNFDNGGDTPNDSDCPDDSAIWGRLLALSNECSNIELNKPSVTVGRSECCDHRLSLSGKRAAQISQRHFRISRVPAGSSSLRVNGAGFNGSNSSGGSSSSSGGGGSGGINVSNFNGSEENGLAAGEHIAVLEDLSSNGTFVDGVKVGKGGRRVLQNNSSVSLLSAANKLWVYITSDADADARQFSSNITSRYVVSDLLGSGGFGEVFRVFEIGTCQQFAMKVISKRMLQVQFQRVSEVDRAIENQEVTNLVHLNHPNIIKIMEFFNEPTHAYILLEYLSGGDLFDRIEETGGLTEPTTKLIGYQLTQAVKYLHDNNVIHRDIKPENVLLVDRNAARPPAVKLTDFGLSKLLHTGTMLRTVCGTPGFTAPEVEALADVEDAGSYSNKCDVWSLGSLLYYCLYVGNFPEQSENAYPADKANVSNAFKELLRGMLCREPQKRFSIEETRWHAWFDDEEMRRAASELTKLNGADAAAPAPVAEPAAPVGDRLSRKRKNETRILAAGVVANQSAAASADEGEPGAKRPRSWCAAL